MNKYEEFAISAHFSEWPENITYAEFIKLLLTTDRIMCCEPSIQFEGYPNDCLAELVLKMHEKLQRNFLPRKY